MGFTSQLSPCCYLGEKVSTKLTPVPTTVIISWDFMLFCSLGGKYLETVKYCDTFIPVLSTIDTPPDSPFSTPNNFRGILSLAVVSL